MFGPTSGLSTKRKKKKMAHYPNQGFINSLGRFKTPRGQTGASGPDPTTQSLY